MPTNTASDVQQQYLNRVEGRVQCTRPPSLIPSLILPKHSPASLSTHYHWRAISSSSFSSFPFPTTTDSSNMTTTSTHNNNNNYNNNNNNNNNHDSLPMALEPSPLCPVTLVASVIPHSSVWPEQTIGSHYQLKPCRQTLLHSTYAIFVYNHVWHCLQTWCK